MADFSKLPFTMNYSIGNDILSVVHYQIGRDFAKT